MKRSKRTILIVLFALLAPILVASAKIMQEASTLEVYHLTTRWFFNAPVEQVWQELVVNDQQWVQAVSSGDKPIGVGTRVVNEVKGELPYTLRFTTEITQFEPPFICEATSTGDLVGTGKWVLESREGGTAATFYWDVGMSNPLLNLLSKIPVARDAMVQNHDEVMEGDYRAIRAKLEGSVAGARP